MMKSSMFLFLVLASTFIAVSSIDEQGVVDLHVKATQGFMRTRDSAYLITVREALKKAQNFPRLQSRIASDLVK